MKTIWMGAAVCVVIWNVLMFFLMGWDKRQAMAGEWRTPEKTFFIASFLFGGLGVALGMKVFHHKTKHYSFRIIVPLGIVTDFVGLGLAFYGNIV